MTRHYPDLGQASDWYYDAYKRWLTNQNRRNFLKKHLKILQPSPNCKDTFPVPPVIAYRRHESIRELLVHSTLHNNTPYKQLPAGVYKCNHPRCLSCPFLREGQTNYIFTPTNEQRKLIDHLFCKSKNVSTIQCNKCKCQYIGETKRQLNERFGTEHRQSILTHQQLSDPTPVSLHFNQAGRSIIVQSQLSQSNPT